MEMSEWTRAAYLKTCMTCKHTDGRTYGRTCSLQQHACKGGDKWELDLDKLDTRTFAEPGEWMRGPHGSTYCSQCGETCTLEGRPLDLSDMPYCPKCGAEMKIDKGEGAGKLR